jgi:hypothetical protein
MRKFAKNPRKANLDTELIIQLIWRLLIRELTMEELKEAFR